MLIRVGPREVINHILLDWIFKCPLLFSFFANPQVILFLLNWTTLTGRQFLIRNLIRQFNQLKVKSRVLPKFAVLYHLGVGWIQSILGHFQTDAAVSIPDGYFSGHKMRSAHELVLTSNFGKLLKKLFF